MKIDSVLLRIAAEIPIRMGGEFVEEYLQAALEPMIRNIAFDENNEVKLFSTEYAYQGLIGAITAGLLEAGPTVARNISNGQAGRGVNAARKADELIGRSLALDTKSEAFKLAGKLADGSILRNDYNVGELLKAYRDAGGNMGFIRMPNVDMAETSADTPSPVEETRTAISENNPVNMTDMVAPKMTPAQIVQSVQEEIGRNVAANPEGVQKTLSGGMSELIAIETRIKTGSGNINHQGIGIDSAHYEFMGYLRGEMALDTTAWTMAEAIKAVMSTQTLTEAETAQLQGLLTEIVGDAELAEAYVSVNIDEQGGSVYNKKKEIEFSAEGKITYFKDEQLKTELNKAFFWSGNSNGVGGMAKAAELAKQNNGITLEMLMEEQEINLPKWDFNNPSAIQAWKDASASYARQASGKIRAIIGSKINPDGVWNTIELPILRVNPKVSKITVIDPETLVETIIFMR